MGSDILSIHEVRVAIMALVMTGFVYSISRDVICEDYAYLVQTLGMFIGWFMSATMLSMIPGTTIALVVIAPAESTVVDYDHPNLIPSVVWSIGYVVLSTAFAISAAMGAARLAIFGYRWRNRHKPGEVEYGDHRSRLDAQSVTKRR